MLDMQSSIKLEEWIFPWCLVFSLRNSPCSSVSQPSYLPPFRIIRSSKRSILRFISSNSLSRPYLALFNRLVFSFESSTIGVGLGIYAGDSYYSIFLSIVSRESTRWASYSARESNRSIIFFLKLDELCIYI